MAGAVGAAAFSAAAPAQADPGSPAVMAPGGAMLAELSRTLASLPRRRDFKTVPMILTRREEWDADALDAVLHYPGSAKQAFDNTAGGRSHRAERSKPGPFIDIG